MTDMIETRVARGVALLDEQMPGWDQRIDLDKLDLSSPCHCILGQTWDAADDEPYTSHARALFGAYTSADAAHGFDLDVLQLQDYSAYAALTDEWRRVILARRDGEGQ